MAGKQHKYDGDRYIAVFQDTCMEFTFFFEVSTGCQSWLFSLLHTSCVRGCRGTVHSGRPWWMIWYKRSCSGAGRARNSRRLSDQALGLSTRQ
jgi:hypothetical protein